MVDTDAAGFIKSICRKTPWSTDWDMVWDEKTTQKGIQQETRAPVSIFVNGEEGPRCFKLRRQYEHAGVEDDR